MGRLCFSETSDRNRQNGKKPPLTDACAFPFFTYTFEDHSGTAARYKPATLYVPLTFYCNTKTLPERKGPNHRLPPDVVATLCRVRDIERGTNNWTFWCKFLDNCESYQQLPLPAKFARVAALSENSLEDPFKNACSDVELDATTEGMISPSEDSEHRPSVEELMKEIEWYFEKSVSSSDQELTTVVVAGEGEPTLRFSALTLLIERLRLLNQKGAQLQMRILTNGLLSVKKTDQLLDVCCQDSCLPIEFCVELMTHCSEQYNELMEPVIPSPTTKALHDEVQITPHVMVQQFIQAVAARQAENQGLPSIEVSAIDRPDVNAKLTNQLAASLGVTKPVRWRRYFK